MESEYSEKGDKSEKSSLLLDDMDEIFSLMDKEKAVRYDEAYIEKLYLNYMLTGVVKSEHLQEIKNTAKGKKILLIAPGKTAVSEKDRIIDFIDQNDPLTFSINHDYGLVDCDYIFISNIRRFKNLSNTVYSKTISTSNIKSNFISK